LLQKFYAREHSAMFTCFRLRNRSIQRESKKQSPVHFTIVSTNVDRSVRYLAQSILR